MSIYKGTTNIGSLAVGAKEQTKTVTPSTSAQVITPDAGYNTLSSVEVDAVTASIDPNIQAENIKKDVEILGVTGTMEPMPPTPQGAIYTLQLADGTMQVVHTADQQTALTTANAAAAMGSYEYESDYVTSIGNGVFYQHSFCRNIITKNCVSVGSYAFRSSYTQVVRLGVLTSIVGCFLNNANVRLVEVGQNTVVNLPFGGWTATNVIAEGQTGIDELNYNIKTYLADQVADRTGLAALTVTFGASLYNVLTAETIVAFTAKNWSVASA